MQEGGASASSKVSLVPGLKQGCSVVLAVSPHSTSQSLVWGSEKGALVPPGVSKHYVCGPGELRLKSPF